jgi:hypothetical protein
MMKVRQTICKDLKLSELDDIGYYHEVVIIISHTPNLFSYDLFNSRPISASQRPDFARFSNKYFRPVY